MPSSRAPRTASTSYESQFELSGLFEFSKVVNSSLELRFVLNHILLTIMGKLMTTRGMVMLAQPDGLFKVEMVKGFPPALEGKTVTVEKIPEDLALVRNVPVDGYPWADFFREAGVVFLLPLFSGDRHVGFLGFGPRAGGRDVQEREMTYLRSLANLSGTAIEKGYMIAEMQQVNRRLDRKLQEMNTLVELGKEFSSVLDPEKLVRLLVFALLGHAGTSRYMICLKHDADMRIVAQKIDGLPPQGELLSGLLRTGAPCELSSLVIGEGADPRKVLAGLGLRVIVPMRHGGETLGLIFLGERIDGKAFSESDLELVMSIGTLAMISLENARLFQETIEKQKLEDELLLAREIQKGLLPAVLPTIRGLQIAATNISSKQVGGDYYDVLDLGNERYVIAIGDVSGKGPPAALLMANLQATIRALVPLNLPLSELTARVNELMCENTGGTKFVTFFWGFLDILTHTLVYVNAGHNYPMLLRADDTVERLDRGGMILGILRAGPVYEEATVELRPGDLLMLFTDGVSEAMSVSSVEYGEERLLEVMRNEKARCVDDIVAAVHRDIEIHARGASQSDDITMMLLKVGEIQ